MAEVKATEEDTSAKVGFEQWALKTVGGIVGGIGLTTWMVIVGSAVVWARAQEAGLPGLQAVAAQPHDEMVLQGAKTALIFAAIAAAAVALLYAVTPFDAEPTGTNRDPQAKTKLVSVAEPQKIGALTIVGLGALTIVGIVWLVTTSLSTWWVVGGGGVAVALLAVSLALGLNQRKNFWALAGAVFVSVVVFAGFAEYAIVRDQHFVQAVAALPTDTKDEGVQGFYVAVDGETLYFAHSNLGEEATSGEDTPKHKPLEKFLLGANATYAVGPLESEEDAAARAESMLRRLRSDRAENPRESGTSAPK